MTFTKISPNNNLRMKTVLVLISSEKWAVQICELVKNEPTSNNNRLWLKFDIFDGHQCASYIFIRRLIRRVFYKFTIKFISLERRNSPHLLHSWIKFLLILSLTFSVVWGITHPYTRARGRVHTHWVRQYGRGVWENERKR